jgi:NAD(P)H dehydrogenase (quinone)
MAKIAIIFHSSFGHTRELARAIAAGVTSSTENECVLLDLESSPPGLWEIIAHADALIFGSPTYMGTVSAP